MLIKEKLESQTNVPFSKNKNETISFREWSSSNLTFLSVETPK